MSYVTRSGLEYICYKKMIGEGKHKKRHAVYGQTQQECLKSMREAEKEYKKQIALLNPADDGNDKCMLCNSMRVWLDSSKYDTVKNRSFDTLESTYTNHLLSSPLGKMQFARVTSDDINAHLKAEKDKGYSLSTMKKVYGLLNQYFNSVYAKDKSNNPMIGVNPITKKDYEIQIVRDIYDEDDDIFVETQQGIDINNSVIILNDEEMRRFVETIDIEYINGVQGWKHGYGLIFIMYSFMRVGEAIALKWKDIDFKNKTVNIYKAASPIRTRDSSDKKTKWVITITKTEAGRRKNTLTNDAFDAIQKHFERQARGRSYEEMKNHYVFETKNGTFAQPSNLYRSVKSICNCAGIDSKKAGLHKLRHTGISYYIRHGAPIDVISAMAGHSSVYVTSQIYYSLVDQQFIDAINIMNNIN